MSTTDSPFLDEWESADGLATGYVKVTPADPPYPAMVFVEFIGPGGDTFAFSMLPDDAALLATKLDAGSHNAETLNRAVTPR